MIINPNTEQSIFAKIQLDLVKEYRPLLKRIEIINSYYCYLTGAVIFEFNQQKVLDEIYPYWQRRKLGKYIDKEENMLDEEVLKIDLHELLKENSKTLTLIQMIKDNVNLLLQNFHTHNWTNKKNNKFNKELEYLLSNKIFDKCYYKTINNIQKIIEITSQRLYKIYFSFLDRKKYLDLIDFCFGKEYLVEKDKQIIENKEQIIAIVYKEQLLLEDAIQLLSLMSDFDYDTYLIWITHSKPNILQS